MVVSTTDAGATAADGVLIGVVLIGGELITGVLAREATVAVSTEATPVVGTRLGVAVVEAGCDARAATPAPDGRGGSGVDGTRRAGDCAVIGFATAFSGGTRRAVVGASVD